MNTDFFGTIDRTSYFSNLNAGVKLIVSFTLIIAALIVRDPSPPESSSPSNCSDSSSSDSDPSTSSPASGHPHRRHHHRLVRRHAQRQKRHHHPRPRLQQHHHRLRRRRRSHDDPLLAMVLPTLAFVLTTDPTDLGDSLAQTFKLPSRFVLATVAALRLVGILFAEWNALSRHDAPADSVHTNPSPDAPKPSAGKASPCSCRLSAAAPASPSPWRRAASAQANAPGLVCRPIRRVMCT